MTTFANNVTIAGNLVADAKIVNTSATLKDGSPFQILEGVLAINGHSDKAQPTFVNVQLVGYNAKRLIDANKHLKGSNFGVFGTLVEESYTNKEGQKRSKIKVVGEDVMFGDKFFGSVNSVTLYGHATADPVKGQKGDTTHARVTIGNSVYDKQKKERVSHFFNLVAFGNKANFLGDYFKKGDAMIIQGRLHSSSYEVEQPDGSTFKQYRLDVVLNDISFAQRKAATSTTSTEAIEEDNPFAGLNLDDYQNDNVDMSGDMGGHFTFTEDDLPF